MLTSMFFALLIEAARKIDNIIQYKDIFDPSPHCINRCPFKWLFECDNELVRVQTYMAYEVFPKT